MKGNIGLLFLVLIPILGSFPVRILMSKGERDNRKTLEKFAECVFLGLTCATFILAGILSVYVIQKGMIQLSVPEVCGLGWNFRMDGFRVLYVLIASFAWMVSSRFALWYMKDEEHKGRYYFYTLLTLGATLGVFLSADLFTTFVFFEIMSLCSYVWVIHEEDEKALRAGNTYLAVAIIGGLVMLMGIFLLYGKFGSLSYQDLIALNRRWGASFRFPLAEGSGAMYAGVLCLLFGFGAKAGAFPLHIWLPKAHPVAPAPASALLSGILTKAGMYGILLICGRMLLDDASFGNFIMFIAVCTMLVGAILALFSIDMKHILACSSVSQIGFILVGAAAMLIMKEEKNLAIQGAILHMINHSAFKLILFLLAGVVVRNLKSRDLNVLRGFGTKRPWFLALFLSAALGITGIPGFSGFVSKSMLHEAIVVCYHDSGVLFYKFTEILFLVAGGCTLAYMLKLFVVLFIAKPSKEVEEFNKKQESYMPLVLKIVLTIPAVFIYVAGTIPEFVFFPIAKRTSDISLFGGLDVGFKTFSLENLQGGLISIVIGIVLYCFVVRPLTERRKNKEILYVNRYPEKLDLENLVYRPVLLKYLPAIGGGVCRLFEMITESLAKAVFAVTRFLAGVFDKLPEMCVIGTRRTILKPVCEKATVSLPDRICNGIGHIMNGISRLNHRIFRKRKDAKVDYVERVNRGADDLGETIKLISRSLSYGLLAFCVGLLLMLGYLLYCM